MAIRVLFTPEQVREFDRCCVCGWHPPTQGHHGECPRGAKSKERQ